MSFLILGLIANSLTYSFDYLSARSVALLLTCCLLTQSWPASLLFQCIFWSCLFASPSLLVSLSPWAKKTKEGPPRSECLHTSSTSSFRIWSFSDAAAAIAERMFTAAVTWWSSGSSPQMVTSKGNEWLKVHICKARREDCHWLDQPFYWVIWQRGSNSASTLRKKRHFWSGEGRPILYHADSTSSTQQISWFGERTHPEENAVVARLRNSILTTLWFTSVLPSPCSPQMAWGKHRAEEWHFPCLGERTSLTLHMTYGLAWSM